MSDAAESYGAFLREAIATYWRTRKGRRVRFLALLLASREAWDVAFDQAATAETARRVLTGVAGAAAVAVVLRVVLGGPLGLLLTGASAAGLLAVFVRSQGEVRAQAVRTRALVERTRTAWEEVATSFRDGRIDRAQRDLMVDGLLRRFLDELDQDEPAAPAPPPPTHDSFADHVATHRRPK